MKKRISTARALWLCGAATVCSVGASAGAQTVPPAATIATDPAGGAAPDDQPAAGDDIVVTGNTTRSVTQISGVEIQKILPGISPLKALQTLPASPSLPPTRGAITNRTSRCSSTASTPSNWAIRSTGCRSAISNMAITTACRRSARSSRRMSAA